MALAEVELYWFLVCSAGDALRVPHQSSLPASKMYDKSAINFHQLIKISLNFHATVLYRLLLL